MKPPNHIRYSKPLYINLPYVNTQCKSCVVCSDSQYILGRVGRVEVVTRTYQISSLATKLHFATASPWLSAMKKYGMLFSRVLFHLQWISFQLCPDDVLLTTLTVTIVTFAQQVLFLLFIYLVTIEMYIENTKPKNDKLIIISYSILTVLM